MPRNWGIVVHIIIANKILLIQNTYYKNKYMFKMLVKILKDKKFIIHSLNITLKSVLTLLALFEKNAIIKRICK